MGDMSVVLPPAPLQVDSIRRSCLLALGYPSRPAAPFIPGAMALLQNIVEPGGVLDGPDLSSTDSYDHIQMLIRPAVNRHAIEDSYIQQQNDEDERVCNKSE